MPRICSVSKIMRQNLKQAVMVPAAVAVVLSLFSSNVFAYLDPSTGSMVVTAIVGIFASIALALKTYWYKFKNLFRRSRKPGTGGQKDPPAKD